MPKKTTSETILYPIVLHHEDNTWGYFIPEIGGGGAASRADALKEAHTLLNAELSRLFEADKPIVVPEIFDADDGQVVYLTITLSNAAERIFLTLPKSLLSQIDEATDNRSAFFAELARERLHV